MLFRKQENILSFILLGAVLIANALFLSRYAFIQLNFFDMAPMLDGAWRVFKGQQPYADFIFPLGPLYLYVMALFFKIFGVGKNAILAQLIFFSSVPAVLGFLLLRRKVSCFLNAGLALLTVTSFCWNIAFPWYDHLAHFWGFLGVFFFLGLAPLTTDKKAAGTGLFCGMMAAAALMSKTNLGTAYFLFFLFVLLFSEKKKSALVGYGLGLLVGVALCFIFFINSSERFIEQLLAHTGAVTSRFRFLFDIRSWFVNDYWVAAVLVLLSGKAFVKGNREYVALFFGITLIGIISVKTGGIIEQANIYLWGLQMVLAFFLIGGARAPDSPRRDPTDIFFRAALAVWAGILCLWSIQSGFSLKVWDRSSTHKPFGTYALQTGPLAGWLTFPGQGQPLDDMVRFVKTFVPQKDSLLNLTDLYLIYLMTGRDSYKGIPIIFHENYSPVPGPQATQVKGTILNHPPQWVIIHLASFQEELRALGLQEEIRQGYVPVYRSGFYCLLKKRP